MDLLFRHSQKRLHPDRADLARAQEIQEVTHGNPDFCRQILRPVELLIERARQTGTCCAPPEKGQYLGLPGVALPIRHYHQTKQGAFPMELMQIFDIELQTRRQVLEGDELRLFPHGCVRLQFFLKPLSQAIPLGVHRLSSRHWLSFIPPTYYTQKIRPEKPSIREIVQTTTEISRAP